MAIVAKYPDSTKTSLEQRLQRQGPRTLAPDHQPAHPPPRDLQLRRRHFGRRHHAQAVKAALCRLRPASGSSRSTAPATTSTTNPSSPPGLPVGTCQDPLDTACRLYFNDPIAWILPRRTSGETTKASELAAARAAREAPRPVSAREPDRTCGWTRGGGLRTTGPRMAHCGPAGEIASQHGRHERWGRLVKQAGLASELRA